MEKDWYAVELSLTTYLILLPVIFLAGVVDAVCGGGGLLTIPAYLLTGFSAHVATGTNLAATICGGVAALCRFARGGKVHWPAMVSAGPTAAVGALLGARFNLFLPDRSLQIILLILLPVMAVTVFMKRELGLEDLMDTLSSRQIRRNSALIGLAVGAYNGFYGAGAGTFFIIAFTLFDRMDLVRASGSTKFCSLCAVLVATLTYTLSGTVVWPMVLAGSVFSVAGNLLGSELALRNGAKVIRPMFIGVLALLFLRLCAGVFL